MFKGGAVSRVSLFCVLHESLPGLHELAYFDGLSLSDVSPARMIFKTKYAENKIDAKRSVLTRAHVVISTRYIVRSLLGHPDGYPLKAYPRFY